MLLVMVVFCLLSQNWNNKYKHNKERTENLKTQIKVRREHAIAQAEVRGESILSVLELKTPLKGEL